MTKLTKRQKVANQLVNPDQLYGVDEALTIVKDYAAKAKTKFDETLDVVVELNVDPRQNDQAIRGAVPMPHGLGKTIKIAVIVKPERVKEAKETGADIFGSDELIEDIKNGKVDFDLCIATPDMMPAVSKLGKVLGPKGLMPNPKLGTVSDDIKTAVANAKAGQVEYKVEKAGIVHAGVGKLSFSADALKENFKVLYEALLAAKPASVKGSYVKKVYLSPTMGPAIRLDLAKVMG